jgi:hypothetical protein
VKQRPPRSVRSTIAAGGLTVLTVLATVATPAGATVATGSPTTLECEPIVCAAAYIGVPAPALAADIVNETIRTGTIGAQIAIRQLDAAMTSQLTASVPSFDSGLIPAYRAVIARHDAIRDALLDQTVTALHSVLGVVSPP